MNQEIQHYLEHQVEAANPAELIGLLFNRALRDVLVAREFLAHGDPASRVEAIRAIIHAQRVVLELNRSLNLEQGGEIARNLRIVYECVMGELDSAVQDGQAEHLAVCEKMLEGIHSSWQTITAQGREGDASLAALRLKEGALVA